MPDLEFIKDITDKHKLLKQEVSKIIVGQEKVIENIIWAIYTGGHALLIGVPGLAKTLTIKTLSEALGLNFKRIQFTPDLMPGDILGSEILNKDKAFEFLKGPVFSNIVLADEINRTPPKTQSALLEAMQEHQVTISGKKYLLDAPYFVLATQNPIEQEGTYPLPEAQLDRFMFSIELDYPNFEEEVNIVLTTTSEKQTTIKPIFNAEEIINIQRLIRRIPVTQHVVEYAVNLVHKTRPNKANTLKIVEQFLDWGAGPRASQNLILAAKTHAILNGKYNPDIEDVKEVAIPILRHRILKNYKAEAENITSDTIIKELL